MSNSFSIKIIRIFLLILVGATTVKGQELTNAQETLEEIAILYRDGLFTEIQDGFPIPKIKLLEGTKAEKTKIYEYLTLTYLYDKEKVQDINNAKLAYKTLLKLTPTYPYQEKDAQLKNFVEQYGIYARPRFSFSFYSGMNLPNSVEIPNPNLPAPADSTATVFTTDLSLDSLYPRLGWQLGTDFRFHFLKDFELGVGISFVERNHRFSGRKATFRGQNPRGDSLLNYYVYEMNENMRWFDFSLFIGMNKTFKPVQVYGNIGMTYNRLWKDQLKNIVSRNNDPTDPNLLRIKEDDDFLILDKDILNIQNTDGTTVALRAINNFSFTGKAGVRIPVESNFLFIEGQATFMLNNMVEAANRYADEQLVFSIGYVDRDRRLNNFMLQVGFQKMLYRISENKNQ